MLSHLPGCQPFALGGSLPPCRPPGTRQLQLNSAGGSEGHLVEKNVHTPALAASPGVLAGGGLQQNQLPAGHAHRQGAVEAVLFRAPGSCLHLQGGRRGLSCGGRAEGSEEDGYAGGPLPLGSLPEPLQLIREHSGEETKWSKNGRQPSLTAVPGPKTESQLVISTTCQVGISILQMGELRLTYSTQVCLGLKLMPVPEEGSWGSRGPLDNPVTEKDAPKRIPLVPEDTPEALEVKGGHIWYKRGPYQGSNWSKVLTRVLGGGMGGVQGGPLHQFCRTQSPFPNWASVSPSTGEKLA